MEYSSDLLRGNTDLLLLCLIGELGSAYGYQLIKEMEKRSGGFFLFKEGTIYPMLRKLESDGLLRGEWRVMPKGPERRYYQMTDKGYEVLHYRKAVWQNFASAINLIFNPGKV